MGVMWWLRSLAFFWMPVLVVSGAWANTKEMTVTYDSREELETATRELTIDTASVPGQVRLLSTALVQDEIGGDFGTHGGLMDTFSGPIRLKKEFILDDNVAFSAEVLVFNGAGAITVNGHPVSKIELVPKTTGAWYKAEFPPSWLNNGLNEVILSGPGRIYFEPHQGPRRSARSVDGGKTWQYINGEYLVRLRLGRFARSGTITSDAIDLATLASEGPIGVPTRLTNLQVEMKADLPEGTGVVLEVRGGPTPSPREDTWTSWTEPENYLSAPDSPAATNRYLQWRAFLSTNSPLQTPSIDSIALKPTLEYNPLPEGLVVSEFQNQKIIRSSLPFAYQAPSEKLTFLRKNWKLDEVVAPGKTELEKFVLLRDWVKHQWLGWEGSCARPWDAVNILSAPENDRGMCVHFGVVFVQCANALGYVARHCILTHHFTSEIWSNQFQRWILMDAGPSGGVAGNRNMHFERDGIPQNAMDVHRAWLKGEQDQILKVASNPADNGPYGDDAKLYMTFYIPPRNNYLDVPQPAEFEHGNPHAHYDGYYWWEDNAAQPIAPEYSLLVSRPADLYWTLNQVEFHLQQAEAGQILVQMDTVTPNFKVYLVKVDDGEWRESPDTFTWSLHPGRNSLQAKTVNAFGIEGILTAVTVEYGG